MTTHLDQHGHAHKPAGTSQGGQFAAKHNSAPTSALEAPKRSSELTAEAIRDAQDVLTRTARAVTRSYRGVDASTAEDVVQDSWVHLLDRDTRLEDIAQRVGEPKFLNLTARTLATRYGHDARFGLRSEDFKARRQLRAAQDEFYLKHGRNMKPSEIEAEANRIRESFKAGARPKPDFYVQTSQLSLDVTHGEGSAETSLGDTLVHADQPGFDDQEDAAALALHDLENKNRTKDDVRKDMWRIMSTRFDGAPQPVRESLDKKAVAAHRKVVRDAGGAGALSLRWLDGEATAAESAALFAPFGELDARQQYAVFEVLDENPSMADNLWNAGMAAAAR